MISNKTEVSENTIKTDFKKLLDHKYDVFESKDYECIDELIKKFKL